MKNLIIFPFLLFSIIANGTAYYVKSSGNDSNSGRSDAQAWRTISKVNSVQFTAGDSILFRCGDEWREMIIVSNSGTANSFITYSSYGTGNAPVVIGSDKITGWNGYSTNVWRASCAPVTKYLGLGYDYMVIADGTMYTQVATLAEVNKANTYYIDKSPSPDIVYIYSDVNPDSKSVEVSSRMFGFFVNMKTYIKLKGMEFRNSGHSGAYFYGGSQIIGNSVVDGCNFYRNRITGIEFYDGYSNSLVQNCRSTYNGNGYYSASYVAVGSNNNTFRNCYSGHIFRYLAGEETDGHGFAVYNSDNCIVEHCEAEYSHFGIIIDANSRPNNFTCRYNYVHDTEPEESGIAVGGNIPAGTVHRVYNNLIINTGSGTRFPYAIAIGGTTREGSVFIFNNTIYQDGASQHSGSGIIASRGSNLVIKNNIVYSNAGNAHLMILTAGPGFVCDYNCYYSPRDANNIFSFNDVNYHSLASWKNATGLDVHSIYGDPLFVSNSSDWNLQPNSPAINSGADVGISEDYSGNPISGTPDIGAYEYQVYENNPPRIDNQEFRIDVDEASTDYIGKVQAYDPDPGQILNLTIIGGNESNLFTLDPHDGDLKISRSIADNDLFEYFLIIKAEDNGNVIKSDTATINIVLNRIPTLVVFPNPSYGKFDILLGEAGRDVTNLTICDVAGKIIFNRYYNPDNSESLKHVDISSNPKGFYFIILKTETETFNKQVIIN